MDDEPPFPEPTPEVLQTLRAAEDAASDDRSRAQFRRLHEALSGPTLPTARQAEALLTQRNSVGLRDRVTEGRPDAGRRDAGRLAGRVAIVTGAAQGIGRALVDALVNERVTGIVAVDRDIGALDGVSETSETSDTSADSSTLLTEQADVTRPGELDRIVALAEREFGHVDIFCSNAGVMSLGGLEAPDEAWQGSWEVNVMAHVRAARAVVPGMLARSSGVLLNVVSAAALLSAPESAPYTATKHAALGFSEWLAITYGHRGIQVCVVCPEAVDTRMRRDARSRRSALGHRLTQSGVVLSPQEVAAAAVASVKAGRFLSTPHPRTVHRAQQKWRDIDAWVSAMNSSVQREG